MNIIEKKTNQVVAVIENQKSLEWFAKNNFNPNDYLVSMTPNEKKREIRKEITKQVGDIDSLLGTTSNATQLLLVGLSTIIVGVNEAKSLSDIKTSIQGFVPMCEGFLDRLQKGKTKLTYTLDNLDDVINEIEKRATATTLVLENAKKKTE